MDNPNPANNFGDQMHNYQPPQQAQPAPQRDQNHSSSAAPQKTNVSLYVCDIPQNITKEDLDQLFKCFAGCIEVRLARDKNRQRIAFVDYADDQSAQYAMNSVRGFKFGQSPKGITVRFSENTKNNAPQPLQTNAQPSNSNNNSRGNNFQQSERGSSQMGSRSSGMHNNNNNRGSTDNKYRQQSQDSYQQYPNNRQQHSNSNQFTPAAPGANPAPQRPDALNQMGGNNTSGMGGNFGSQSQQQYDILQNQPPIAPGSMMHQQMRYGPSNPTAQVAPGFSHGPQTQFPGAAGPSTDQQASQPPFDFTQAQNSSGFGQAGNAVQSSFQQTSQYAPNTSQPHNQQPAGQQNPDFQQQAFGQAPNSLPAAAPQTGNSGAPGGGISSDLWNQLNTFNSMITNVVASSASDPAAQQTNTAVAQQQQPQIPSSNQQPTGSGDTQNLLMNLLQNLQQKTQQVAQQPLNQVQQNQQPTVHQAVSNPEPQMSGNLKETHDGRKDFAPHSQQQQEQRLAAKRVKEVVYPVDHFTIPKLASPIVMIEGLPADATEREVAHIFRPFVGYKSTKIIQGELSASKMINAQNEKSKSEIGDSDQSSPVLNTHDKKKDMLPLICYVHFENTMQSTAVINTVQGYRFDKNDQGGLQLSYWQQQLESQADGARSMRNNASCVQGTGQEVVANQPHLATEMFSQAAQVSSNLVGVKPHIQ